MIDQPHNGAAIQFDDWRRLNNDYMVVGSMQSDGPIITASPTNSTMSDQATPAGIPNQRQSAGLEVGGHQIADAVSRRYWEFAALFHPHCLISVLGHLPNKSFQLIVADADGENPHVVMQSREPLMSPSWSPDGTSLAYVSFEDRLPTMYVQTLKTGERHVVSAHAGVNQAPAWSPDSKKMALVLSTRDGNLDIYVLDLATQQLTRITDDPGIDTEPQWSKDGQSLYFTSDRAGGPQIYKVGLARRQTAPSDLSRQLQRAAARFTG